MQPRINGDRTIGDALGDINDTGAGEMIVVDDGGRPMGRVRGQEILAALLLDADGALRSRCRDWVVHERQVA